MEGTRIVALRRYTGWMLSSPTSVLRYTPLGTQLELHPVFTHPPSFYVLRFAASRGHVFYKWYKKDVPRKAAKRRTLTA